MYSTASSRDFDFLYRSRHLEPSLRHDRGSDLRYGLAAAAAPHAARASGGDANNRLRRPWPN